MRKRDPKIERLHEESASEEEIPDYYSGEEDDIQQIIEVVDSGEVLCKMGDGSIQLVDPDILLMHPGLFADFLAQKEKQVERTNAAIPRVRRSQLRDFIAPPFIEDN
jgi:hypothetical protein